jgi:hypothetical protein
MSREWVTLRGLDIQRGWVMLGGLVVGRDVPVTDEQGWLPVIGEKARFVDAVGVRIPPFELRPHVLGPVESTQFRVSQRCVTKISEWHRTRCWAELG